MAGKKRCLYCGEPLVSVGQTESYDDNHLYCTSCKQNQGFLRKALNTSCYHYNIGLEKAMVRDLSGAIDSLHTALRYNKRNIDARNLLGLIYYETGDVVQALSHWVVSANYQKKGNLAVGYLGELRDDPRRLDEANQIIRMYNQALTQAGQRNFDLAIIQLKKVIAGNPHFVRGHLLFGLIYIEQGRMGKAKKSLARVLAIDKTNTEAIHLLYEIGETDQTIMKIRDSIDSDAWKENYYGVEKTDNNSNNSYINPNGEYYEDELSDSEAEQVAFDPDSDVDMVATNAEEKPKARPAIKILSEISTRKKPEHRISRYQEVNHAKNSNIYMLVGLAIGILILCFIIIPAKNRSLRQEISNLEASYGEELASKNSTISYQDQQIKNLQGDYNELEKDNESLNLEIDQLNLDIESLKKKLPQDDDFEGGSSNRHEDIDIPMYDIDNMIKNE